MIDQRIRDWLHDSDPANRAAAMVHLAELEDEESLTLLSQSARHEKDEWNYVLALYCLYDRGALTEEVLDAIYRVLDSPKLRFCYWLLLREKGLAPSHETTLLGLADEAWYVVLGCALHRGYASPDTLEKIREGMAHHTWSHYKQTVRPIRHFSALWRGDVARRMLSKLQSTETFDDA